MKRTAICAALLAAMAVMGTALHNHTDRTVENISSRVAQLREMTSREEMIFAAHGISDDWERFCAENIFLTNNEGAAEISEALVHITAELEAGDDDVREECIGTEMLLEMYARSCSPLPENIF
ncbi:MAG: hypothetical protein IK093_02065 [Ruminiclostridium sp.]|nr:hypothetical protein [Ruminiclostridium sp.]